MYDVEQEQDHNGTFILNQEINQTVYDTCIIYL